MGLDIYNYRETEAIILEHFQNEKDIEKMQCRNKQIKEQLNQVPDMRLLASITGDIDRLYHYDGMRYALEVRYYGGSKITVIMTQNSPITVSDLFTEFYESPHGMLLFEDNPYNLIHKKELVEGNHHYKIVKYGKNGGPIPHHFGM